MSSIITFQRNTQGMWTCNMQLPEQSAGSSRFTGANSHWTSKLPVVQEEDDDDCSSSSIGKNSDGDDDVSDGEVTSQDNGPFGGLNDLEAALPIKRGISKFYDGKSKSYGSLADAENVPSIQDIGKEENAYSRKRKNMIAHAVLLEKLCDSSSEDGVSKRLTRCAESGENMNKSSLMVGGGSPPLYRNGRMAVNDGSSDSSRRVYMAPRRSLSLSDMMSEVTGSVSGKRDDEV